MPSSSAPVVAAEVTETVSVPECSTTTTNDTTPYIPDNLVVRSAFAHSLRATAPRPFNEFLEHFACAMLLGRYIVHAQQDANDAEQLSLGLNLPSYADESEEGMREGFVVVAEGTELTEKARAMFEDIAQNNTPAAMLADMCKGPLKTLFEYVQSQASALSDNPALPALKRAMHHALESTMQAMSPKAEALASARLPDLDPILAEGEAFLINALKEATEEEEFKAYFTRIAELHSVLHEDSVAAIHDLMNAPADEEEEDEHAHSHEGGCCGGH